jgi:protein-S-isoprenylcysteine O-methyltransferase Ste14
VVVFLFSIIAYVIGLSSMAAFFWFIQFLVDMGLSNFSWDYVGFNCLIFLIFPAQHSLLARPAVKRRIVQRFGPLIERPIYVATSGIAMWLILLNWRRFGPVLYRFENPIIFNLIFYLSLALIIASTIALDHGSMFGLKQGYAALRKLNFPEADLKTTGIYGIVRHPLTTLLIVCLWSHESLTAGRLLFNLLFTAYALAGTFFEERDLVRNFGERYRLYRTKVPGFLPWKAIARRRT